MGRRLILITYDGGSSNFLPGVEKDRIAYLNYFKSHLGGSYTSREIVEFNNSTILTGAFLNKQIQFLVSHEGVDFLTIVFCGHGYGVSNGDTVMLLGPNFSCSVMCLCQICKKVQTLLITDCCRKMHLRTTNFFRINNNFNVSYATEFNNFALENGEGGLYSQNIIKSAFAKVKMGSSVNYSIQDVHILASLYVCVKTNKRQHPEIAGRQINSLIFAYK